MTEEDTYRILRRCSFGEIIRNQADYYGMADKDFIRDISLRILNGATPNDEWDLFWPGWTFEEVTEEIIRIKNDN